MKKVVGAKLRRFFYLLVKGSFRGECAFDGEKDGRTVLVAAGVPFKRYTGEINLKDGSAFKLSAMRITRVFMSTEKPVAVGSVVNLY